MLGPWKKFADQWMTKQPASMLVVCGLICTLLIMGVGMLKREKNMELASDLTTINDIIPVFHVCHKHQTSQTKH